MSKNNKNFKVIKLATAGLALTAAASPVYTQVFPTSQVALAAITVNNVTELRQAIANAQAGGVITISPTFSETLTENNAGGTTLKIDKDVTLQGSGNTLTLRGVNLEASANVAINNLNLAMIGSGTSAGTITSTGGTLTLDNVTTKISDQQAGTRPAVYTNGGNLTIINGNDETKFDKIVDNGTTPTAINLESSNIVVTNGVTLQDNTTVKTASNFTSKFTGPGDVIFSRAIISDVELSNVENITTEAGADVKLKSDLATPITNKITVEDGTKFNAMNNLLEVKELAGLGNYYMQHDGKLTVTTITDATKIEIQKNDVNYDIHNGKVYVAATNVNAEPVITIQNDPTQYEIKRHTGDFVLEKTNEVDKTFLLDELDIANADIENKIPNASQATKTSFDEALKKAKEVFADTNATQEQVDAAQEALQKAYEALTPDTNPTTKAPETTQAPVVTDAPATKAPETTQAPVVTDAPTTKAPETTQAPVVTDAPTTKAPETTQAPIAVTDKVTPLEQPIKPELTLPTTVVPTTSILLSEEIITKVVTETPVTKVVTDAPTTIIVSDDRTTKILTETPATKVVTEAPATKIVTEVVAVTQIITQKSEQPKSNTELTRIETATVNAISNSSKVTTAQKNVSTEKSAEKKILPKTSAVKEETKSNNVILFSLVALFTILMIKLGLKKNNK